MSAEPQPDQEPFTVTSLDGRSFDVEAIGGIGLRVGEYVSFADPSGTTRLGFVENTSSPTQGSGAILPMRGADAFDPISATPAVPCPLDRLATLLSGRPAEMCIGQLVAHPEVPVGLLGPRFNRHTFWCGQSGSGKTYALGVALEQILLHTELPVVIFDPNSDFVRLDEPRDGIAAADGERLAALDIEVLRPEADEPGLCVRFRSMSPEAQAAILRLDPIADRGEYNVLRHLGSELADDPARIPDLIRRHGGLGAEEIAQRLENLDIFGWDCWSFGRTPATEIIARRPAATVLDLGAFHRVEEQLSVAVAVLDDLWARREERRPVLLVIDEAHNLCAPQTESLLGRRVRDRLIQIAAEGRKFGLWLLLSTQRPSKLHPQILSQCDNLTLMRMNSPGDLAELGEVFGFVPPAMLAQSARFRQGEALLAGGFVASPSIVKVRDRLTVEGGIDVPVPMRATTK